METITTRRYEGMFLIDSAIAASDWDGINELITKILTKAGAQAVSVNKWDERRLAYEVDGKSRGTYILVYFDCDPLKIGSIERDVQLSEQIMRILVVRTERMSEEEMVKATPAMEAVIQAAARAEAAEAAAKAKEVAAEEAAKAKEVAAEEAAKAKEAVADEPEETKAAEEAPVAVTEEAPVTEDTPEAKSDDDAAESDATVAEEPKSDEPQSEEKTE